MGKKRKPSRRKHRAKLAGLLASKLIMSVIAFIVGLYTGSLISNTFVALIVGTVFAALIYLLFVLHMLDWLKIEGQ